MKKSMKSSKSYSSEILGYSKKTLHIVLHPNLHIKLMMMKIVTGDSTEERQNFIIKSYIKFVWV